MTQQQYDKLLKSGLILFKERQLQSIPPEKEITYEFSRKFEVKMKKLMFNRENSVWLFMQKTGNKVAVFIIALILSFSASLSIKAVREAVFDFVYKIFSDHTYISQNTGTDKDMTEYYIIPYLPDGYKESEFTNISEAGAYLYWVNEFKKQIVFSQSTSSGFTTFDSEGSEVIEIMVNGVPVLYCNNGSKINCSWNEKDRVFQLIYPSELGEEYVGKVVGNLVDTEPIILSDN